MLSLRPPSDYFLANDCSFVLAEKSRLFGVMLLVTKLHWSFYGMLRDVCDPMFGVCVMST